MKKNKIIFTARNFIVVLLMGYVFLAGMNMDNWASSPPPEVIPEPAFYTRWYESVFPPEVIPEPKPEPAFYVRWYEWVFPPEVIPEPEVIPDPPAFYTRWWRSVFGPEEEVITQEVIEDILKEVAPQPTPERDYYGNEITS